MTKEDIIKLAHEAGDLFYGYNLGVNKTPEKIKQHFGVEE
jgi:hypothetical protein